MGRPTRRQVLQSGAVAGGLSLSGCFWLDSDYSCEENTLVHERDAPLETTASWPTFRYGVGNTGYNPNATVPKEGVTMQWRFTACSGTESGVAVANGRVYAGDAILDGRDGSLIAGDWGGYQSTPTVSDGAVYVGMHSLESYDATDGSNRWTFHFEGDSGAGPAPKVTNGVVYFAGNLGDRALYAADVADGSERWRFVPEGEFNTAPAVVDSTVFAIDQTGFVYALDAQTGNQQWRRKLDEDYLSTPPVVADGLVFVNPANGVLALDGTDGRTQWHYDAVGNVVEPVAVADDTVFISREEKLTALDAGDGSVRWKQSVGVSGPPSVASETVLIGDDNGVLSALDRADGSKRWQFQTRSVELSDYEEEGISVAPAIVDGVVYVATRASDIYALGPASS